MNENFVITIGRQFGSGGRNIGKLLAEKLGINFYDKELIDLAAEESGMSKELFEHIDETATNKLFYSMVGSYTYGSRLPAFFDMSLNDKLFLIQSEIIKNLATKESCIIVGRCADYVLKENKNIVNVFIHTNMENRIDRISKKYSLDKEKAEALIAKTDKKRSSFYNYYSGQKWGEAKNYNLSVDSHIGEETVVQLIINYIDLIGLGKAEAEK